jgi:hypothetical protein
MHNCAFCQHPLRPLTEWKGNDGRFYCSEFCADAGAGNNSLDGSASADSLTATPATTRCVQHQGNGDTVNNFAGNGAAAGGVLQFVGYGVGASFTTIDAKHWQVNYNGITQHDIITFLNGTPIDTTDYSFV